MRQKILEELQKKEEDKIMLSFKTEKRYKLIFERVCKHEGHSMSSVLNALLKIYVNEFFEDEYKDIRVLMKESISILEKESNKDDIFFPPSREILDFKEAYSQVYEGIFSLSDDGTYIPYENDIDNLASSNKADSIYNSLTFDSETN